MHDSSNNKNMDGIFLLNKPMGISSNHALQFVKYFFNAQKAGHTGSLDPLASGLLPICLGEATKFSSLLLESQKKYQLTAKLGEKTSTGDVEGYVLETKPTPAITEEYLKKLFHSFTGKIEQCPPMHSALKHQGQPLYKLARKNIGIERKKRIIEIYDLNLLDLKNNFLKFTVSCSKGTYVRTLVEDIGDALGCGAHITNLKRTEVNHYNIRESYSLFDLKKHISSHLENCLLPISSITTAYKTLKISKSVAHYLLNGQPIIYPRTPPASSGNTYFLQLKDGQFLGLAHLLADGKLSAKRLINPNTLK